MRLVAAVAAASLLASAAIACSTFSSSDDESDASAPDATSEPPPDVAETSMTDAGDAADADASWGCKGTAATWDLSTSTPPSPISADLVDVPSFVSMTEDGGTFGRFTMSLDRPDGSTSGPPRGLRYGISLGPSTTHICLSARIRTPQPTPGNASVDVLLAAGYTGADDTSFGVASLNYAGSVITINAGFGPQADSGVPPVEKPLAGQVADWHVARVETFREAAQLRFTVTFDGVPQVDVTPVPPTALVDNGGSAFGPSTDTVIDGGQAIVDYADIRADVE